MLNLLFRLNFRVGKMSLNRHRSSLSLQTKPKNRLMTLKHARLFILFVLIFSSQITSAQQPGGAAIFSIKGKVVDDSNGQPLEFATVAVKRMREDVYKRQQIY